MLYIWVKAIIIHQPDDHPTEKVVLQIFVVPKFSVG